MKQPIEIDTGRLRLRRWREEDREPLAAMNADPEVMRYFPAPQTREASDRSFDTWQRDFDQRGWSNWAVELKADGGFIGFVGLTVPWRTLPFTPCVEIGWRLAHAHWRRGYASEAARAALRVGFTALRLDEIVSFTALVNLPSRAVMERIGMADAHEDFDHPALADGHPLQRHCLYRLSRQRWAALAE
jgi:RimJ/RimL family protein N-acetyltransferase